MSPHRARPCLPLLLLMRGCIRAGTAQHAQGCTQAAGEPALHVKVRRGATAAQVAKAVFMNRKLKWPASTPVKYRKMAAACMAYDPEDRPMFSECVEQLHDMWAMYDRCGD